MKIDLQITSIYYVTLKLGMVDNVLAWKSEITDVKIILTVFFLWLTFSSSFLWNIYIYMYIYSKEYNNIYVYNI